MDLLRLQKLQVSVRYKIGVLQDESPKEAFKQALSELGMRLTGDVGVERVASDPLYLPKPEWPTFITTFVRKREHGL